MIVDKFTPTYNLEQFKVSNYGITVKASIDAAKIGFDRKEIMQVVSTMQRRHFYKSMTSKYDHMEEKLRIHPETGKVLYRGVRPIEYEYMGEKLTVDMPGWYPSDDTDGVFSREDWAVSDAALAELKRRYEDKINCPKKIMIA